MRQILLYIFLMFVCSVSAEQFKITGKVVNASENEPLIGTTVQIKGTDRRVAADIDGNFSIEVEKGEILRFSYIGYYSKEVEVLNDSSLVIELEENGEPLPPEVITNVPIRRPPKILFERDTLKTNPKNQKSMINH